MVYKPKNMDTSGLDIALVEENDAVDSYFECITACSLDEEGVECVTRCVDIHLKDDPE